MKNKYLNQYFDIVTQEMSKFKVKDVQQVCTRLSSGDYSMLAQIVRVGKGNEVESHKLIDHRVESIDKKVSKKLEETYQAFEQIF